jgi:hypothetical protein
MPVTLRIRDDLSVNDIVRLGRDHLVKVTPHVGNWTPARLVLPTLGISILCVDQTIGEKDINAHPHLLIRGGKARVICEHPHLMTTHARVTTRAHDHTHTIGTSISQVHVGALRTLYPKANIVTHSEHLQQYEDVTIKVVEEGHRLSPRYVWWREVTEKGDILQWSKERLQSIGKEDTGFIQCGFVFPFNREKPKGMLIHNRVNILMDVILQSWMGTEPEIYHLSGPDMVRYLGGEMTAISRMYDHVRKRLALPQETITFNLVPFASFRFATRLSQAKACEGLCEELNATEPRQNVLDELLSGACDVIAESVTKRYFTQHDCLTTGDHVVVPEIARGWSMATCAKHMERIRTLV